VIAVVAQLILDKQNDKKAAGHTDGQAGNVNERVGFVFLDVAKGDFQVILDHNNLISY